MKKVFSKITFKKEYLVYIVVLLSLVASIQALTRSKKTFVEGGKEYTHYNNYVIFANSFHHLKDNKDLYILYPEEQWDLYKYTPTFAAFFGAFAVFPDWLGYNLWNLFNALLLVFAIYYLPGITDKKKNILLALCLIELMTSLQNGQSNALIAGLLILAFGLLEKEKFLWATLCVVFTVYIKLFGIVGFALFLFYPQKMKLALYSVLWTVLLFVLPLLFVGVQQYEFLFRSYWNMLYHDHNISYGYSVMGWLNSWLGTDVNKLAVVLAGAVLFMIPFYKIKSYQYFDFRILALASVLIWVVIFNHKAESPTFIIAMSGVALWFVAGRTSTLNIVLLVFAFVFTSLSPTDIFPRFIRNEYVIPYSLKAVPCIFVWFKIVYDQLSYKNEISDDKTPAAV